MVKMLGSAWPARCIVMSCWTGSALLGSRLTFGCLQGWTEARMIQGEGAGGGRRDLSINHPSFLFIFHLVCPESRDYLSMLSQSWLITPPDQNNGGMSAVSTLSVGRSS